MNVETSSPVETRELGAAIAGVARPGDVILLAGDLGAGKTTFVQGFGTALGVAEPITSPTFTLMHNYEGRVRVVHVDVYRLERLQEILDLGITELVDDDAVGLIEWGDVAEAVLPADFLEIRIAYSDGDDTVRRFTLRPVGPSWQTRASALADATARWKDGE